MVVKDLVKQLNRFDPEAVVILRNTEGTSPTLHNVEQEEAVQDLDGWDLLGDWRNVKEMEDYYGSTDSDPLAFTSVCVLS